MKILLVGLGSIGQRHVRCLRALEGDAIELIAARTRGLGRAIGDDLVARDGVSLEELYHIRSYPELDAALAEQPDAALVCTPNHLHVEPAIRIARAGVHLFVEKPVSHDLAGLDELARIVAERGLVCCVGYNLRFHPGLEQMIGRVREGALGTIVSAHFDFGEYMPYWHRYEDYAETFMARAAEGGGIALTQIHDLDIAYALFGLPSRVFAVGGSTGTLRMDAEDHVSGVLVYASEIPFAATLNQDCLRYPTRRAYTVSGTRGTLDFDAAKNTLRLCPFDASPEVLYADPALPRNAMFMAQMKHFLACLRGEASPRVDLAGGVQSLRIALAIKESLACAQPIEPGKVKS